MVKYGHVFEVERRQLVSMPVYNSGFQSLVRAFYMVKAIVGPFSEYYTIQHTTLSAVTHCLHVWSAAARDCFYRVGPRNFPVSRGKPEPFKPCSAASPPVSPGQVWARARPLSLCWKNICTEIQKYLVSSSDVWMKP